MQETPAGVQREAKALLAGLRELTKKNGQLVKEVDFQRKNLRSQYLRLLLSYPYSKEAKDIESHLWMQTSYQFISSFKQKIAAFDRKLYGGQGQVGKQEARADRNFVEYRKLLQRFRQYLADEERFYSLLLVRLQKVFGLHEVQHAFVKLDLLAVEQDDAINQGRGRDVLPEQQDVDVPSTEQRENLILTVGKFLVCLGDIARYRERYNDSEGRARAGTDEAMPRKTTPRGGRKPGNHIPRPRNYSRSRLIYEQSRLLVPDDGNASHQLAVLSAYEKDNFSTLYHYYRALCVRCPYDPASENLTNVLHKAAGQYRASNREEINDSARRDQKARLTRFESWIVLLHGLWYLDNDETASNAIKLAKNIGLEFVALVTERVIHPDAISKTIMLALGSLWKLRIVRDTVKAIESPRNKLVEPLMVMHILDLAQGLLTTGRIYLLDDADIQDKEDLGQRIPAVLRRSLPSIRVIMKWLRSNLSYVLTVNQTNASSEQLQNAVRDFWICWTQFFSALVEVFPAERLPPFRGPLEEDVEMCGFSPIKRHLVTQPDKTDNGLGPGQVLVHPNEEFLMRITDLLNDAYALSQSEGCPVVFAGEKYLVRDESDAEPPVITSPTGGLEDIMERHPNPPRVQARNDDGSTTQTSRTEDDPAGEAIRAALAAGAEDDDDEIVWAPRLHESPKAIPLEAAANSMSTPIQTKDIHYAIESRQQLLHSTTTAQDLLNGVLGIKLSHRSPARQLSGVDSSAFAGSSNRIQDAMPIPHATQHLLFGPGSPRAPTSSIWSSTGEELVSGTRIPNPSIPPNQFLAAPDHYTQSLSMGSLPVGNDTGMYHGKAAGFGSSAMMSSTGSPFLGQPYPSHNLVSSNSHHFQDATSADFHDPMPGHPANNMRIPFPTDPFLGFANPPQTAWSKR